MLNSRKGTCDISDCRDPLLAGSLCGKHYWRFRTYGDPLGGGAARMRGFTAEERFWAKVDKTATCWLWTAHVNSDGYGKFGSVAAHRFAYDLLVGKIRKGLVIDHLCRVRHCVNPDHMEPVTILENVRRGDSGKAQSSRTHCPRGHAYDEANTAISFRHGSRERNCRACHREWARKYAARKKAS